MKGPLRILFAALLGLSLMGVSAGLGYIQGRHDATNAAATQATAPEEASNFEVKVVTQQGPVVMFRHTMYGWSAGKVFYHQHLDAVRRGWPGGIFVQTTYKDGTTTEMFCTGDLEAFVCNGDVGPPRLKDIHHLTLMPGSQNPVDLDLRQ